MELVFVAGLSKSTFLADSKKDIDLDANLLPLFRKSKIDAIKKRAKEIKDSIDKAREKAEAFYRLADWKGKKADSFWITRTMRV